MSGDDELKILDEVERTADRMAVYRIAKDFTNTYFQVEYTGVDISMASVRNYVFLWLFIQLSRERC